MNTPQTVTLTLTLAEAELVQTALRDRATFLHCCHMDAESAQHTSLRQRTMRLIRKARNGS